MPRRVSPEENERRLNLYKQGFSDGEIAEKVGVKVSTIRSWRLKRELSPNHKRGGSLKLSEQLKRLSLYFKGLTDRELSEKLGISTFTVKHWRRSMELPPNRPINTCIICGKKFEAMHHTDKYCKNCQKELKYLKKAKYLTAIDIRRDLYKLAMVNPEKAINILNQIKEEEGEEFYTQHFKGVIEKLGDKDVN